MKVDYRSWLSMSEADFREGDLAEHNLQAATVLPGAERLSIPDAMSQVAQWTELVALGTERCLRQDPALAGEPTEGHFRMLVMATVLQRNLGARYNLDFATGEYDARDSRSLFIHGLLEGIGGSCVSMPILSLAIGRRLDYPLFLVEAKEHFFLRWAEPDLVFNIECAADGFLSHRDEYYLQWPQPILEHERQHFLRNLSPREEAATMLAQRGCCLQDNLRLEEAVAAFQAANTLAPGHLCYPSFVRVASAMLELHKIGNPFSRVAQRHGSAATRLAQSELERIHSLQTQSDVDDIDALFAGGLRI